eukprot:TRINITY_DN56020_c0_g1_i1.p1 TRINITY_DN56020_c0_g1~~TRINITY_DN56020_c0_g1_i1.p1  ORF type:complete len:133 (-),score=10.77 TRINITY_DN56020_c0_g1_i1:91-489(-)
MSSLLLVTCYVPVVTHSAHLEYVVPVNGATLHPKRRCKQQMSEVLSLAQPRETDAAQSLVIWRIPLTLTHSFTYLAFFNPHLVYPRKTNPKVTMNYTQNLSVIWFEDTKRTKKPDGNCQVSTGERPPVAENY